MAESRLRLPGEGERVTERDCLVGTRTFSGVMKKFGNDKEVAIVQHCAYTKC